MAPADDLVETDPRPMPAEFQYLMVVVALFALLLLAGVPGRDEQPAGERAAATPSRAWASRWSARVQAERASQAASQPSVQPALLPDSTEPKR